MRLTTGTRVAVVALVAFALAGCGNSSRSRLGNATTVIGAWSSALRHGELRAAAGYFALPSVFVNGAGDGADVITIRTAAQAEFVNETLPCGARLVSVHRQGRFFNGRFLLTGRPGPGGSDCLPGAGETAYVDFAISGGKITAWFRVSSETAPPTVPIPAPSQSGGGSVD